MGQFWARIGDRDVLTSGSLVSNGVEPVEIFPVDGDTFKVEIVFEDASDSSPPDTRVHSSKEVINEKHTKWTLVNFNSSLGLGTSEPVLVGTHQKRKLYLSIVVHTIGGQTAKITRLISFCFSLGDEANA